MRRMFVATTLFLVAHVASAAVPTKDSIDTLLTITQVERTLDTFFDNMETVRKQAAAQMFAGQTLTPEQEKSRDALNAKTTRIVRDELSWPKMETMYVQIYQATFTQEEVDGLIAFYRSPTGMAYTAKLPIVQQKSLAATQAMMGPMMEKLQAAMKESIDEAKAAQPR